PYFSSKFSLRQRPRVQWLAVMATMVLLFAMHLPAMFDLGRAGLYPWQIAVESSRTPPGVPVKALTLIRDEGLAGNMVTDYAWGQYVLWHAFPKIRVAFDGRYRTIYPEKLEQEFLAFIKADTTDSNRFQILDDYPTDIVLLPSAAPASRQMMDRTGWVRIL